MKVVCVTGASGYIASWLVKLLLARGYTVHATVRSLDDPKKTEHLLSFDGANERLSLFEANLNEEGSFDTALKGCVCVFHLASPVVSAVSDEDPQVRFIDPAVKGTLNVLKSAAKVPSLKRVVFTSSSKAVTFAKESLESSDVVDETWFSDPSICERNKLWYALSKTLAEAAAMKFSEENGLELVTIIPCFAIGPFLQPTLNPTSECFMKLIETGKGFSPDGIGRFVDVRDVANAHILAFENAEANGRYLIVGHVVHSSVFMEIVDTLFPSLGHSESYESRKRAEELHYSVSRARAEGLGVSFTPIEVTIKDTIECFKSKNLLTL